MKFIAYVMTDDSDSPKDFEIEMSEKWKAMEEYADADNPSLEDGDWYDDNLEYFEKELRKNLAKRLKNYPWYSLCCVYTVNNGFVFET